MQSRTSALRIAIDARSHAATTGGVQQFTLGLLSALSKLSAGEEFLAFSRPGSRDWIRPALHGQVSLLDAPAPFVTRGPIGSLGRRAAHHLPWVRRLRRRTTAWTSEALPRSDGTLERAGVEVVHFVRQQAMLTDIPSIYHPWDLQHIHLPEFFKSAELRRRITHYEAFARQASRVVAASTWAKNDFSAHLGISPECIVVVPVALDPTLYAIPTAREVGSVRRRYDLPHRFLLYPAQTWPHKNHIRLIEAIAIARHVLGETIQVVCTGFQNEHFEELQIALQAQHLVHQVRFVGYVSPDDIRAFYGAATGLVFPSLFEGWGIPVAESFLYGVPVACSSATSLPALVGEAARIFDPLDPQDIARAMVEIWTDTDLRERLITRGRLRLLDFDSVTVARTYLAIYREVAGLKLSTEDSALLSAPPRV